MIDFIAERTYQYYVEQNTETSYTDALHEELKTGGDSHRQPGACIEAGIFSSATKTRMDELEQQKEALETALADAELISGLRRDQGAYQILPVAIPLPWILTSRRASGGSLTSL